MLLALIVKSIEGIGLVLLATLLVVLRLVYIQRCAPTLAAAAFTCTCETDVA